MVINKVKYGLILPVVFYGHETWSQVNEGAEIGGFQNRVLRIMD
jgi:hypothetical protein